MLSKLVLGLLLLGADAGAPLSFFTLSSRRPLAVERQSGAGEAENGVIGSTPVGPGEEQAVLSQPGSRALVDGSDSPARRRTRPVRVPMGLRSGSASSWFGTGFLRRSDLIDSDGFLLETFDVVDGCEEELGAQRNRIAFHKCMRVRQVPGDGSCLFHSLAHGLRANASRPPGGEGARQLRATLMDWLSRNPEARIADTPVTDWVKWDSNCSVDDYANRMRGFGWGGGIEMAAFARHFNVDVHVYERDRDGNADDYPYKRVARFEAGDAAARRHQQPPRRGDRPGGLGPPPVNVLYRGGVHYDALVASPEALVELSGDAARPPRPKHASPRLDPHQHRAPLRQNGPVYGADRFDARHRTSAPHQNDRHHPQKHHNYGYFGHQGKKPSAANHKFYGSHRPFPYRRPW